MCFMICDLCSQSVRNRDLIVSKGSYQYLMFLYEKIRIRNWEHRTTAINAIGYVEA